MRIVISGATGSIGSMLMARLAPSHEVVGWVEIKKINEMVQRFSMKPAILSRMNSNRSFRTLTVSSTVRLRCPEGKASQF